MKLSKPAISAMSPARDPAQARLDLDETKMLSDQGTVFNGVFTRLDMQ
jgi:hypothetical protein